MTVRVYCDTYWGSHGCCLPPGHTGRHACACCPNPETHESDPTHDPECAGAWPYYGPFTRLYGDDAPKENQ